MEILRGIFEIAIGRASGLTRFGATPRAFLTSLYVLMALPGLSTLVLLARDGLAAALSVALLLVCALLTPMIISHTLAQFWQREAEWMGFATAFNWSRFSILAAFALMLLLTAVVIRLGMPRETAANLLMAGMSFYSMWLEWFVARRALRVSNGRALLVMAAINAGTFIVLAVPSLAQRLLMGEAGAD